MAAEITEPFTAANGRLQTQLPDWADDSASMAIVSNSVQWSAANSSGNAFHDTALSNADHYAQITATVGTTEYTGCGVIVRGNGDIGSIDGYRCEFAVYDSGGLDHQVAITRVDNGAGTEVASANQGAEDTSPHTLRVEVTGNTIEVFVDGLSELVYAGATSYTTNTRVGIYAGRFGAAATAVIDDFEAGTSGGVAALPQKPIIVGQGAAVQRATAW